MSHLFNILAVLITIIYDILYFLCLYYNLTILEDFTEELLGLHDAEIQRLRLHYEDHKELFDGVNQWEESWRLFLELEVSTTEQEIENNKS